MEACSVRRRAIVGPAGNGRHTRRKAGAIRNHGHRSGIALAWTSIVLVVMVGMVGLSIDWGKLVWNVHQLQNAADAAALAGADVVKTPGADPVGRAYTLALANIADGLVVTLSKAAQPDPFTGDQNTWDILLGRWIKQMREFVPTLNAPNAVRVMARREGLDAAAPRLPMLFGPIFGVQTANAAREAIGWSHGLSGAGLIILDPAARPGLKVLGTGKVNVENGGIQVNSQGTGVKTSASVYVSGTGNMQCGQLTLDGEIDPAPSDFTEWEKIWDYGERLPFGIVEDAGQMLDPLAGVPVPTIPKDGSGNYIYPTAATIDNKWVADHPGPLEPGYYPGGINISSATLNLKPGTYLLGGGNPPGNQSFGLCLTGGAVIGHGVTLYITKDYVDANGKYGKVYIGGNVVVDITPPGDETTPKVIDGAPGISIWQDRNNLQPTTLAGGGGMMISGTLYFPKNEVDLAGTPGKAGNQILAGSMQINGTANVSVDYDDRNFTKSDTVVLVE